MFIEEDLFTMLDIRKVIKKSSSNKSLISNDNLSTSLTLNKSLNKSGTIDGNFNVFLGKFKNLSEFLIKNESITQIISLTCYDNGKLFVIMTECSKSKNLYVYDYNNFKNKFSVDPLTKCLFYCNHYDKGDTLISLNGWQLVYHKISIFKTIKKVCIKNIIGISESNKELKLFKIIEFRINYNNPDNKTSTQSYLNAAIIQRQNILYFLNIETITVMYVYKLEFIPIYYDIMCVEIYSSNKQSIKKNTNNSKIKSKMSFIDKYFNEDEDFGKCFENNENDSLNQTNSTFIKDKTEDYELDIEDIVRNFY